MTEAADRPDLSLPSAQDELISAVAAANPRTVVVTDAGAPVAMPWLGQVPAVVDAWYPGESNGTALASVLYGATDPSGHLPVTFPRSLSQVPASTPAQFPGVNGQVHYSEGLDAHDLSYWNDAANGWVVPAGGFRVYVGDSSALPGLPLRGGFTVPGGSG